MFDKMNYRLNFTKFEGCGNDFLIFDETRRRTTSDLTRSKLAMMLTDRHFSVGADGLMFLDSSEGHDCSMRLFEPAGNEADMCGNGIRCVAAYLMDKLRKDEVDILTRDGPKQIMRVKKEYQVDMGRIRTRREDLERYVTDKGRPADSMLEFSFKAGDRIYEGSLVNSGEPHIVVRSRSLHKLDIVRIGESVNSDKKRFPEGVNVDFVQVAGPNSISIRTYERGVYDETLACGTGATASAAVAVMLGWVRQGRVDVLTKGGRLSIELDSENRARMMGPARQVYSGVVSVDV